MRALTFPAGRGAVAALSLAAVLAPFAPPGAPASADPERRLDDVRRRLDETAAEHGDARERLDDARGGLTGVDDRRRRAIAQLRQVEERQGELATRLAAVEGELADAQEGLATAEDRLADTAAALTEREAGLRETREELGTWRARFGTRARAAYKRGGGGYVSLALDLSDAAAVGRGLAYVERVLDHDRATVERIANLQRQVEEQVAGLREMRERRAAQRAVAERERDRLAELLAEQEAVARAVAAEAERHRGLVTELDADRESYLALVGDLEIESAALESELARLGAQESEAREEVRRAERERAREEAEERAREEAEEARAREVAAAEAAAAEAEEARRAEEERRGSRSADRGADPTPAPRTPAPAPSPAAPSPSPAPSASPSPDSGTDTVRLRRPVAGPVTSGYGYRTHPIHGDRRLHAGIDFGAPHGSPVTAAAGGTVAVAGDRGGYGLTVVVDHGGGLTTLYAHLSAFGVSTGQRVTAGERVGAVGSTGFSTGPHLHFEVRVNGRPRDPAAYL